MYAWNIPGPVYQLTSLQFLFLVTPSKLRIKRQKYKALRAFISLIYLDFTVFGVVRASEIRVASKLFELLNRAKLTDAVNFNNDQPNNSIVHI